MTAEQARREFHADLDWLPFDLHPEYPPEGIALRELHARYGIGVDDDEVCISVAAGRHLTAGLHESEHGF